MRFHHQAPSSYRETRSEGMEWHCLLSMRKVIIKPPSPPPLAFPPTMLKDARTPDRSSFDAG
jgi:hypothetical protein